MERTFHAGRQISSETPIFTATFEIGTKYKFTMLLKRCSNIGLMWDVQYSLRKRFCEDLSLVSKVAAPIKIDYNSVY